MKQLNSWLLSIRTVSAYLQLKSQYFPYGFLITTSNKQNKVDLPVEEPGMRSSMCIQIPVGTKKRSETSSNAVVLSISVAEMDIFHSYVGMVPLNCILVIPFGISLGSDRKEASHHPHHCTTLVGGLNYSQKS